MDAISEKLSRLLKKLDQVDFQGQEKIEKGNQRLMLFTTIICFLVGMFLESFQITVYGMLIILLITIIVPIYLNLASFSQIYVPNWRCWNKNPIVWYDQRKQKRQVKN